MKQQEVEQKLKHLEERHTAVKRLLEISYEVNNALRADVERLTKQQFKPEPTTLLHIGESQVTLTNMGPIQRLVEEGRIQFESGMVRDGSKDKPRFDLISPLDIPFDEQMLTRWAKLMNYGANHYSARNWEKADGPEELARFKESAMRHFMQWIYGEINEDHASAVLFNITGAEMVKSKMKHFNETMVEDHPDENEIKDDLSKLTGE